MWPHDQELEKFFKRVDNVEDDDDDEEGVLHNEYADRFR